MARTATARAVDAPMPVNTLLRSAAVEMATLSEMSGGLHDLIARQMGANVALDESIEEAQAIDLLVQHLQTVGAFLRLLADEMPQELEVNFGRMRGGLSLVGLANRLGGSIGEDAEEAPSGDLDLF